MEHGNCIGAARCKECKAILQIGSGVSVLKRHSCCGQPPIASSTVPITKFIQRTTTVSAAAKTRFGKAIAFFCAKDLRPFEAVKGNGFRKLISETLQTGSLVGAVNIDELIPEPRTISRYIPGIANERRTKLKEKYQPVFSKYGGAVTLDFWTDDHRKYPYLSITGHFIDDEFQLKNILIGVYPWNASQSQSAENVRNFLYQKLDEAGITDRQKVIFVTDEGSNLKKALENDVRLNCTAHVLNTALKNVFEQEAKKSPASRGPEIELLETCNKLVSYIHQSKVKSLLSHAIISDVDTRWHSKVDMIDSLLKSWDEIEDILSSRDDEKSKKNLDRLHSIDRTNLEQLFIVLEPIRKAILEVQKTSYPTLPGVLFECHTLIKALARSDDDEDWMRSLKSRLSDSIKRKLPICREHRIATVLHPSFRKLTIPGMTEIEKRRAYDAIHDIIAESSGHQDTGSPSIPAQRLLLMVQHWLRSAPESRWIRFWMNFAHLIKETNKMN